MKLKIRKFHYQMWQCRQLHCLCGEWVHTQRIQVITSNGVKPWGGVGRLPRIPLLLVEAATAAEIPYPEEMYRRTRSHVIALGIRSRAMRRDKAGHHG